MKFNTLDLHGIRHSEVTVEVENYLYNKTKTNQNLLVF